MNQYRAAPFWVAILFLLGCKQPPLVIEKGVYYWKNDDAYLSNAECAFLETSGVKKMYVKFFEVKAIGEAETQPYAQTHLVFEPCRALFQDSAKAANNQQIAIIPTVFVRNELFLPSNKADLGLLADRVLGLIDQIYAEKFEHNGHEVHEIQIDCDWTKKSKERYFAFLNQVKTKSRKTISCTLRLYPYRYPNIMGVPPVDKTMLMCYNLISPFSDDQKNSILDLEELESYIKPAPKYPLHTDIALPVFSWIISYHDDRFSGMINTSFLSKKPVLKPIRPMWFEVQQDIELSDRYLRAGDQLKIEKLSDTDLQSAIRLIKKHVPLDSQTTIALFQLDETQLGQYSSENLLSYYTSFAVRAGK
jgi:hypothetical protein